MAERDLDPHRNTVPDAANFTVLAVDESGSVSRRPAVQSDLRHCASCTCPPATPPTEGATDA